MNTKSAAEEQLFNDYFQTVGMEIKEAITQAEKTKALVYYNLCQGVLQLHLSKTRGKTKNENSSREGRSF